CQVSVLFFFFFFFKQKTAYEMPKVQTCALPISEERGDVLAGKLHAEGGPFSTGGARDRHRARVPRTEYPSDPVRVFAVRKGARQIGRASGRAREECREIGCGLGVRWGFGLLVAM